MTRPWTPAERTVWDERQSLNVRWPSPEPVYHPSVPRARPYRQPPKPIERGGRLLFVMLFWFGLAASVELWWLGLPAGSLNTAGGIWTAAGRLAGMVAGFTLLAQVLLMSRVRWLERWVGAQDLLRWHRTLGAVLTVTVLGHTSMIVVGYAALGDESVTGQAWTMLTTDKGLLKAFIAAGVMVTVAALSIRAIRRSLPYEIWYWVHLTSYLVLLLGYGHQFRYGQELVSSGFGRWYWTGLHVFVLANVVFGRLVSPLWLNLRHRLRVLDIVWEGTGAVSIYVGGRHLDRLAVRAGQFFRWRFLASGYWWQTHPFSLSAAPNSQWLRLTVKAAGGYTSKLQSLHPGVPVLAYGPSGTFTAEHRVGNRALLIAGGSGIAPVRALLEDLPPGAVVVYRASTPADVLFQAELDQLARERGARVWYVLGARDDPGPRRLFTPRGLRELVPDVRHRDVYLCGPPGLVNHSRDILRRLRVPGRRIHLDPFEF